VRRCLLSSEQVLEAGSGSWERGDVARDQFLDQMQSSDMGLFEMLCGCTELHEPAPRVCVQAWVEVQKYTAFFVINCLFAFEGARCFERFATTVRGCLAISLTRF
jgi:hypothetical protein